MQLFPNLSSLENSIFMDHFTKALLLRPDPGRQWVSRIWKHVPDFCSMAPAIPGHHITTRVPPLSTRMSPFPLPFRESQVSASPPEGFSDLPPASSLTSLPPCHTFHQWIFLKCTFHYLEPNRFIPPQQHPTRAPCPIPLRLVSFQCKISLFNISVSLMNA